MRDNGDTTTGFDFWFRTKLSKEEKNFKGAVNSEDLMISVGCPQDAKYGIPENWQDFSVPVKTAYEYLQEIGYFQPLNYEPAINPLLLQKNWVQIFEKQF